MEKSITRKSLKTSGMALLLCVLMLIGTTFAWFTDSITNSGNKIQAGTLDIDLVQLGKTLSGAQKEAMGETVIDDQFYSIADIEAPVFNYDKWEPGYTDVKVLGVQNKGSLALKYRLDLVAQGTLGKLADVIDVYVKISDSAITEVPASFADIIAENSGFQNAGTLSSLMKDADGAAYGQLTAKANAYAVIALHMNENAGNEYQGGTVGTSFDIVLNATQLNSEKDGFDNSDYDADAQYDGYASTEEELKLLLANAEPGDTIAITNDFTLSHKGSFPDGTYDTYLVKENVTVDLKGHTVTLAKGGQKNALALAANGIHLKGGELKIADPKTTYPLFVTAGAQDVVIEDMTIDGGIQVIGNSNATLKNVTINATNFYDIYLEYNSQVTVESGVFNNKDGMPHFYTATPTDKVIVNGGEFKGGEPTHRGNGTFVNNIK